MRSGMQLRRRLRGICQAAFEALRGARLGFFLVLGKALFKAFFIHCESLLGCHFTGQLDGEAKRIIQMECLRAVDLLRFAVQLAHQLFKFFGTLF